MAEPPEHRVPEGVSGPEQGAAGGTRERIASAMFAADDEASFSCTWYELKPTRKEYWYKLAEAAMRAGLRSAPPTGEAEVNVAVRKVRDACGRAGWPDDTDGGSGT